MNDNQHMGIIGVVCVAAVVINLIWAAFAYNLKIGRLEIERDKAAIAAGFVPKQVAYDKFVYIKPEAKE